MTLRVVPEGLAAAGAAVEALTAKYEQYRLHPPDGAVWRLALDEVRWWRASDLRA